MIDQPSPGYEPVTTVSIFLGGHLTDEQEQIMTGHIDRLLTQMGLMPGSPITSFDRGCV